MNKQDIKKDSTDQNVEPPSTLENVNNNPCASLMHNGCESTQFQSQFIGSNTAITSESQMNQITPSIPFGGSQRYSDLQTISLPQNHNGYINYHHDPPPPYDWNDYTQPEVQQYLHRRDETLPVQHITYQPKIKNDDCTLKVFAIGSGIFCLAMWFIIYCFI